MIPVGTLPAVHLAKGSEARRFFQKFKNDEILTAKVLSRKGGKGDQSQVRLLINGKPVSVKAAIPLFVGQEIRLALTHEKNGISLRFLTSELSEKTRDSSLPTNLSASVDTSEKQSLTWEASERHQLTKHGFASTGKWVSALSKGVEMERLFPGDMQAGKEQRAGIGKFQEMSALLDGKGSLSTGEKTISDLLFATSLSKTRNLSRLFSGKEAALEKIFSALSLKSDVPDKDFLPKLLSFGGLLFEKKMASVLETKGVASFRELLPQIVQQDAKGAALEALHQAIEKEASSSGRAGFSDTIESVQIVNSHTSESGRYFLPFPIADPQGFRLGQLFVDLGGKQEKDQENNRKNIKIAFLLEMSQIGHVRADFSILDRAITGRFLFENTEACAYADSMIPRLKEGLAKAGFHAAAIDCVVAKPREIDPGVFMDACLEQVSDSEVHIVI